MNVVVGYDSKNIIATYTAVDSILEHASKPVKFTFLNKNTLNVFVRERGKYDSTEFSISRFLTPYLCDYQGWSLYIDNDVIVKSDISYLFDNIDDRYDVMVVKHDHNPKNDVKFLGNVQTKYERKNWSSVIMFNNSRCTNLTPDVVNSADGLYLHQFRWASSIGSIDNSWNVLAGITKSDRPNIIHYTDGMPYLKEAINCDYADEWIDVYNRINHVG